MRCLVIPETIIPMVSGYTWNMEHSRDIWEDPVFDSIEEHQHKYLATISDIHFQSIHAYFCIAHLRDSVLHSKQFPLITQVMYRNCLL